MNARMLAGGTAALPVSRVRENQPVPGAARARGRRRTLGFLPGDAFEKGPGRW